MPFLSYRLLLLSTLAAVCYGCEEITIRDTNGVIEVPNSIPSSGCVKWLFSYKVPATIQLRIVWFNFGVREDVCKGNYLEVELPESRHVSKRLCGYLQSGQGLKTQLAVKTMVITMQLMSTPGPNEGFRIGYSSDPVCGGVRFGAGGWVSSPRHPAAYRATSCTWKLYVPADKLQLRVRYGVNLAPGDSLVIVDGDRSNDAVLHRYEGEIKGPLVLDASADRVTLIFNGSNPNGLAATGFNITYQQKGHCLPEQRSCHWEQDCFWVNQACDGIWDCPISGDDEKGCLNCPPGTFACSEGKCYPRRERCNGFTQCQDFADEKNCNDLLCGPHNGTFLCDNGRCIYETWRCDGQVDCVDRSDERSCSEHISRKVVTAATLGSIVCGLLMVVALGCTCRLYALRFSHYPRLDAPMTRIQAFFASRVPPPTYNEAVRTVESYDEVTNDEQDAEEDDPLIQLSNDTERQTDSARTDTISTGSGETHELNDFTQRDDVSQLSLPLRSLGSTDTASQRSMPLLSLPPPQYSAQAGDAVSTTENHSPPPAYTDPVFPTCRSQPCLQAEPSSHSQQLPETSDTPACKDNEVTPDGHVEQRGNDVEAGCSHHVETFNVKDTQTSSSSVLTACTDSPDNVFQPEGAADSSMM